MTEQRDNPLSLQDMVEGRTVPLGTSAAPDLDAEIDRLARFIIAEVAGEPSQSEGAVDTAIRIIRKQQRMLKLATPPPFPPDVPDVPALVAALRKAEAALDKIALQVRPWAGTWDNPCSDLEHIANTIESTGRTIDWEYEGEDL